MQLIALMTKKLNLSTNTKRTGSLYTYVHILLYSTVIGQLSFVKEIQLIYNLMHTKRTGSLYTYVHILLYSTVIGPFMKEIQLI